MLLPGMSLQLGSSVSPFLLPGDWRPSQYRPRGWNGKS